MSPPRVTVSRLLGSILVTAVVLAAVTQATEFWVGVIATLTALGFVRAAGQAIRSRGRARAFWCGSVATGAAYLLAAFGPWADDASQDGIPTNRMLRGAAKAILPDDRWKLVGNDPRGNPHSRAKLSGFHIIEQVFSLPKPGVPRTPYSIVISFNSPGMRMKFGSRDGIAGAMIGNRETDGFPETGHLLLSLAIAPIGGLLAWTIAGTNRLIRRYRSPAGGVVSPPVVPRKSFGSMTPPPAGDRP